MSGGIKIYTGKNRTVYLINQAILKLLKTKSLKQITIKNICEEAMIGRSTFYNHYQDKYQVLEQINHNFAKLLDTSLKKRFMSGDIEVILTELILELDQESFLILIDIQESSINLRNDLKEILEKNFVRFCNHSTSVKNWNISIDFAKELFSSVALTFIEYSIKAGDIDRNSQFINKYQKELFHSLNGKSNNSI